MGDCMQGVNPPLKLKTCYCIDLTYNLMTGGERWTKTAPTQLKTRCKVLGLLIVTAIYSLSYRDHKAHCSCILAFLAL